MRKRFKYLFITSLCLLLFSCTEERKDIPDRKPNISLEYNECIDDTSKYYIVSFYPYGNLKSTGFINKMKKDLVWTEFDDDGDILDEQFYNYGILHQKGELIPRREIIPNE